MFFFAQMTHLDCSQSHPWNSFIFFGRPHNGGKWKPDGVSQGFEVVRAEQQFEVRLQSRCNRCLQQSRFSAAYLLISVGDFASVSQNRATVKHVVHQIVRCASLHLTIPLDYNTWTCVWLKLPCSTHASTCVCHAARWNDLQGNGAFSPLFTAAPLSGSLPKPTLGRGESWPVCGT